MGETSRVIRGLTFVLVAFLAACSGAGRNLRTGGMAFLIEPEPGPVYRHITKQDDYRQWRHWEGRAPVLHGTEAGGPLLAYVTYVNDICARSIKDGLELADGSVIVREKYSADDKLSGITVMCKIRRNKYTGSWYWVKYDPDGVAVASGY